MRERTSAVFARIFTAWGVAGVTAPVAAGALFDATGGYGTMLVILGVVSVLAALASLALPAPPQRVASAGAADRRASRTAQ